ncbi:MAG: phosphoribosylformimino-5-aminoimidazole carboxamide ribotide isomerase [Lachnospiraceae bacterium]|nr:phosphoribosylformimino-5-aminoimidazole carboxamide ribotide isomerase [Lachnospiraceae bacterium]
MEFRPCIDIHNGKVKQIVGGSLKDRGDHATENFVSEQDAAFYAKLYESRGLTGGHVILLNALSSEYYADTKKQALLALSAAPGTLQVGGGMNPENSAEFLEAGATHVVVTSYVFSDGDVNLRHLGEMRDVAGRERLVLDLSCRKKDGKYLIVTDRWQKFTKVELTVEALDYFAEYADEFLIHAVDVEGKASGIDEDLVRLLSEASIPSTYAGGVGSFADLERLKECGRGKVNVTIGSALDLFGGNMPFEDVIRFISEDTK